MVRHAAPGQRGEAQAGQVGALPLSGYMASTPALHRAAQTLVLCLVLILLCYLPAMQI